jgi:F-type H+-transporting ATPase subunit b
VGAHRRVIDGIDQRQARIKAELEEARRLREEAQALLVEYQRKRHEADREAEAIIATANAEAERLAAEGKARLEDFVARRTKMAETKIAQAEAQALADVRSSAADAAVAAAEKILSTTAKGKIADDLLVRGIADLRKSFN